MCPAFSLLTILEAVSQVGITGWNSVSWEHPLPASPGALERSGALALLHSAKGAGGVPRVPFPAQQHGHWAEGRDSCSRGAPLSASVREHRTSQDRGLGATWANAVGQLCRGWGSAVTTKLCVLSPHTHTEIAHSNQCGRKEVFTGPFLRAANHLIIPELLGIARRASAVILWVPPWVLSMPTFSGVKSSLLSVVLNTYIDTYIHQDSFISLLNDHSLEKSHTQTLSPAQTEVTLPISSAVLVLRWTEQGPTAFFWCTVPGIFRSLCKLDLSQFKFLK